MGYQIIEEQVPPRHLAVKRFSASPDRMAERIGEAFGAVFGYLARHGIDPAGPPVGCYEMGAKKFDVRAGCPIDTQIAPEDGVEIYDLRGGEVLTTVHVGPYDDLPRAYEALEVRAHELGRTLDPDLMWEEYLNGPETPPDQTQTVIHWPLRAA